MEDIDEWRRLLLLALVLGLPVVAMHTCMSYSKEVSRIDGGGRFRFLISLISSI